MNLLQIIIGSLVMLLLAGLYKPWWVLWWMARQNRKSVLLIYGTPLSMVLAAYLFCLFYRA